MNFYYSEKGVLVNVISRQTIQDRHGLSESAVRKNASKCPGSEKIGTAWVFPDTKKTASFFNKIWKRKRKIKK